MAWQKTSFSVRGRDLTMVKPLWDTEARAQLYITTYGPPNDAKPRYKQRMKLASELVIGDSVLDVGCGVGHLYPHVKTKVRVYKGVDNSFNMVKLARTHNPRGIFDVADAYDLSKEGEYDTVIALSLLIHTEFKDVEKVIHQLWSHAKKALVFTIPLKSPEGTRKVSSPFPLILTYLLRQTLTRILEKLFPTQIRILPMGKGVLGHGHKDFYVQVVR